MKSNANGWHQFAILHQKIDKPNRVREGSKEQRGRNFTVYRFETKAESELKVADVKLFTLRSRLSPLKVESEEMRNQSASQLNRLT